MENRDNHFESETGLVLKDDTLYRARRVLDYLNDNPRVGFAAGFTMAAGGVGAMFLYGSKIFH